MSSRTQHWLWSTIALSCLATAASAQTPFVDHFDGYAVGSVINGQNGWKQWGSAANASSIVEDGTTGFARTGRSVSVNAFVAGDTSDLVHEFTGFTSGPQTMRAYTYSATGSVNKWYFIIMSQYTDVGPFAWGAQVIFDPTAGTWSADHGTGTPVTGPLIMDQWVEVRAQIDLTADTAEVFYNGSSVAAPYCWSCGIFGGAPNPLSAKIAAVDLYHDPATATPSGKAYWDDFSLTNGFPPAAFVDSFDSYAVGSVINGQGGWKQWGSAANASSVIEDGMTGFARSGNSVSVNAFVGGDTSDLVHEFPGLDYGQHTVRSYTYSATGATDKWFFILMSRYTDVGPYAWGAQLTLDPTAGTWAADHGGATPTTGPLAVDQWVEVRAEVDLDADLAEVFYNGVSVAAPYCWSCGVFGGVANPLARRIAAVDLYHNPATATPSGKAYWDDFSVTDGFAPRAVTYCAAKLNSLGCLPAIGANGTASSTNGTVFTVTGSNLRNNKPAMLVYTDGGRAATPFFGGTLCISAPIRRAPVLNAGGTPGPVSDCSGVYSLDMNAFANGALGGTPAAFLLIPGTVVNAQIWSRDQGFPVPDNAGLTDGVEWVVGS